MSVDGTKPAGSGTPWHIWVVGLLGLVWNGMGALDYVMTQAGVEAYLSQFSDEERAFFTGIPAWATATWALSVWSAVLGSIFILLRKRYAEWCFGLAVVTFVLTGVYTYAIADPNMVEVVGGFALGFAAIIFAVTALLLMYSQTMERRGILR